MKDSREPDLAKVDDKELLKGLRVELESKSRSFAHDGHSHGGSSREGFQPN